MTPQEKTRAELEAIVSQQAESIDIMASDLATAETMLKNRQKTVECLIKINESHCEIIDILRRTAWESQAYAIIAYLCCIALLVVMSWGVPVCP